MNKRIKDNKKAFIVKKIVERRGVDKSYVYKILDGIRDNERILSDYMELSEQIDITVDNVLLAEVNRLVPFNLERQHTSDRQLLIFEP